MKLFRTLFAAILLAVTSITTVNAQITGPAKEDINSPEAPKYAAKYLRGGVPVVDGKVVLSRDFDLPAGFDREATIEKISSWLVRCSKDDRMTQFSRLETKLPMTAQTFIIQKLVFSKSFLSLDQCDLQYVLTVSVVDKGIHMEMSKIIYKYNENNKLNTYKAEEMITDKVALRKNGLSIYPGYKKFRMKTIDLLDEYQTSLKNALGVGE